MTKQDKTVRVHLTNVVGAGATQLVKSLLPALESNTITPVSEIFLPDRGDLATYRSKISAIRVTQYHRHVPNSLSRILECTLLGRRFSGVSPLLVLGDLPLRCNAPQTVFVQTSHLTSPKRFKWTGHDFKFAISRWIFRQNAPFAKAFIVQSSVMKANMIRTYPEIVDRLHVIAQPVPDWLLNTGLKRQGRQESTDRRLSLVYPAAMYPHKNHRLLQQISPGSADRWPVKNFTLTIPPNQTPAPAIAWVKCRGFLSPSQMIETYDQTDGLIFLSTDESFGFPLIEAMFVGIPIVCPDLPYARSLCGNEAIYFDPGSIDSLEVAVNELHRRLSRGWWPDWSRQVDPLPRDWETVARLMLDIATAP